MKHQSYYISYKNEYHELDINLKILTFSKAEGVEMIFDSGIHTYAGGDNNYCIFLTHNGELMIYRSMYSAVVTCAFWEISPLQGFKYDKRNASLFSPDDIDLALLSYVTWYGDPADVEEIYKENGKVIPEE